MAYKTRSLAVLASAIAVVAPSAQAQYSAAIEPALRYASMSEVSQAGSRIVHESGWLPGIGGKLAYRSGAWEAYAAAAVFQADINYDGQLQNGRKYRSETGTRMSEAQLGLRYRIFGNTDIVTALGIDSWRRDIEGNGQAIGLREHTWSGRVLVGIEQAWRLGSGASLAAGLNLVHAAPEHLRIGFAGLLDDVSMRTRSANGGMLTLSYQPSDASRLSFGARFDTIRVPRSAAYPVTRDGRAAGEVTQPEHLRKNLTLSVRYSF